MRKVLISLAAAGSALALATPATAQYYQQPYYGGQPYGYGYGYNNRAQMQRDLQQIRISADNLARTGRLTNREARDLFSDINAAERALYRTNTPWEARALNDRLARIRHELRRYSDYDYGRRGYGWNGYNGYNNGYYDRDRDGRDDRYEDDHGWRPDR
jgi:hypothetical protein